MFIFKDNRYFQVSNRLALLAGLVLAVTALAGLPRGDATALPDGQASSAISQSADARPETAETASKSRWKVRFLLFRHG